MTVIHHSDDTDRELDTSPSTLGDSNSQGYRTPPLDQLLCSLPPFDAHAHSITRPLHVTISCICNFKTFVCRILDKHHASSVLDKRERKCFRLGLLPVDAVPFIFKMASGMLDRRFFLFMLFLSTLACF